MGALFIREGGGIVADENCIAIGFNISEEKLQ